MPSLKSIGRQIAEHAIGSPLDRALANAGRESSPSFLFCWNRGLGDIALGLVPLFARIRREAPAVRISVITRNELATAFEMARVDAVHVLQDLQRQQRIDLRSTCRRLALDYKSFSAVFEYPDPDRWLEGKRQEFPPALIWNPAWDALAERLVEPAPDRTLIGVHVNSETTQHYGYVKDWPSIAWQDLFSLFHRSDGVQWVLLGHQAEPRYDGANITDLRGKTNLRDLLSVIKNHCRLLIAPDSGVLTMTYYLAIPFDIEVISLWSDPRQGILKQGCASPNPRLRHVFLIGPDEDIQKLAVADVAAIARDALARARASGGQR